MSAIDFLRRTDDNFSLVTSSNKTYSMMGWVKKMELYARMRIMEAKNGILTFHKEDGTVMGVFLIGSGLDHDDRCVIANKNGVVDWNHYEVSGTYSGMKRVDDDPAAWYDIDKETGKIISKVKFSKNLIGQ